MLLDLVIDLFWPSRESKSLERAERIALHGGGTLPVQWQVPGAFKRALNHSGWLNHKVVAAGMVTQGRTQSLFQDHHGPGAAEEGDAAAPLEDPPEGVRARGDRRPRGRARSEPLEGRPRGTGVDVVKIKNEQRGSWRRGQVH